MSDKTPHGLEANEIQRSAMLKRTGFLKSIGRGIASRTQMAHRILVIDDDPAILDLVELELEQESFQVIRAESAAEGLERLKDSRPHAVILDLHLPDRPGQELLEFSHRTRPQLPIVVLTAAAGVEEAVDALTHGLNDAEPLIRAACAWALGQCGGDAARYALEVRRGMESDSLVLAEIGAGLRGCW